MSKVIDETLDHLEWLKCPFCSKKHYRYRDRSKTFKCISCGGSFTVDLQKKTVTRVQSPLFLVR